MKNKSLAAVVILFAVVLSVAQTTPTQPGTTQPATDALKKMPPETHTGCLVAPNAKGNYSVKIARFNTAIELIASDAVKADAMKPHVGHLVEVTGTRTGDPRGIRPLVVSKLTMKSASCAPTAPTPTR